MFYGTFKNNFILDKNTFHTRKNIFESRVGILAHILRSIFPNC